MDALELLKNDHEKIRALIQQIDNADETQIRRQILEELRDEVLAHSHLEEEAFYPFFRRFPEMNTLLEQAEKDHRKIDELSGQLLGHERAYAELRGWISNHFEEEENEFFPLVRQTLQRSDRLELGQRLTDYKSAPGKAA